MKKKYNEEFEENLKLATIFSSFSVICGNFLLAERYSLSDEDEYVLRLIKVQIGYLKKGLIIEKIEKLDITPEMSYSINIVRKFKCIEENVIVIVDKIENVLGILEGNKKINKKIIIEVFAFSMKMAQNFIK